MIFTIETNKTNNNNFIFNRKDKALNADISFIKNDNLPSTNQIKIKKHELNDTRIKVHNIANNVRITAAPRAIRSGEFNYYLFKFNEGFPEVINYNFCPEKLSTVFHTGSKNLYYSYGSNLRKSSFISYVDGPSFNSCEIICDILSPDNSFMVYSASDNNLSYLKDFITDTIVEYNKEYYIPKIFNITISNTGNLGLDGCYYFDVENDTFLGSNSSNYYDVKEVSFRLLTNPSVCVEFNLLLQNKDNELIEVKTIIDLLFDTNTGIMTSSNCKEITFPSTLCLAGESDISDRPPRPPRDCPATEAEEVKVMSDDQGGYILHIIPKTIKTSACNRYLQVNYLDNYQKSLSDGWQNLGEILDDDSTSPNTTKLNIFILSNIPENTCYMQVRISQEC